MHLLVIEELEDCFQNSIDTIRHNFGNIENFVVIKLVNGRYTILKDNFINIKKKHYDNPFSFFNYVFKKFPQLIVFRIFKPNYPLNPKLYSEINDNFPNKKYDYIFSNGEECGLEGYFLERFNLNAINYLKKQNLKTLPNNSLNCSLMKKAGRHFFSLSLRKFYYEECFELLFNSPRSISINLTPSCNYTCLKCQFHSSLLDEDKKVKYKDSYVDLKKYEFFLKKVSKYKLLKTIYPNITGEPLIHPKIVEIVKLTKKYNFHCGFTTNGFLLSKTLTHQLIEAGIGPLAFSLDTLNKEKYNKIQSGGDLGIVEENIKYFNKVFKEKNGYPGGVINFVLDHQNEEEKNEFVKKWNSEGMNVQISSYYNIFDKNRPYYNNEDWGPGTRKPCWALWMGLFLTADGRVVSCGAMAKTLGLKENIFKTSPDKLWRSEALNKLRKQQLTGTKPGYCKEFTCWTAPITTYVEENNQLILKSQATNNYYPIQKKNIYWFYY